MLKTLEEIYQEMLEVFAQQSGYRPHSACDLAARLYAAAAQVQALYAQATWVLDQSFPQTAQGEFLDYHGETRNISRIAATAAEGVLRFSIDQAVSQSLNIPMGVGVKYKLKSRLNLGCEFSFRKLFGDSFDVTNGSNEILDNPYGISSSAFKNKDWYSLLMISITWDFGERCRPCNNKYSNGAY